MTDTQKCGWVKQGFVRVHAYIYTSTTPQTRDKYKTKGDHKAENA
jgi:hypothetical protein